MTQMLRNDKLDLACILTDGLVKDQLAGNPAKIIQGYVQSPLEWGIFAFAKAKYQKLNDVQKPHFAISRKGSGSHLMSYLLAQREDWPVEELVFEVVHSIEGAVEELTTQTGANLFLWEKHMTQPLVEQGLLKSLGSIKGDWPSFVIAAAPAALSDKTALSNVLEVINNYTIDFRNVPKMDQLIASTFKLEIATARKWLKGVRYSQDQVRKNTLDQLMTDLCSAGITNSKVDPSNLLAELA